MFKRVASLLTALLCAGAVQLLHAEGPNDPAPFINARGAVNGKKVLFDNAHEETAGAADWVIDGGFSDFGNALADAGFYVKELRKAGTITLSDLSGYDVFVIAEANVPLKPSEQAAMLQYVQNGGAIFFIADHYNADRNKNRWDGSEVFNGYRRGAWSNPAKGMDAGETASAAMQGVVSSDWLATNFGIRFRYNALGDITANDIVAPAQAFGITAGVSTVAMHAGGTLAIIDPNKAKGIVYLPPTTVKWASAVDQGVYDGGGRPEGPFVAVSKVNLGKAAFIGDSSPIEDATPKYLKEETGAAKTTYAGWSEQNDATLMVNIVTWLANQESYTSLNQVSGLQLDSPTALLAMEDPASSTEPQAEPWAAPAAGYLWYDPSTFKPGSYGYGSAAANTVTATISTPSGNVTIASGASQSFAGSATDSSSSATLSYGWTFGDGGTASTASASHTYTNTGSTAAVYTATLTATDNTGSVGTASRTITVNPATTTLSASITTPSGNVTVASGAAQSFVGTATGGSSPYTYSWTFGDGGTASTASASHAYTNTGTSNVTYTATFKATDSLGATSSATRTITVTPATTGGTTFTEVESNNSIATANVVGSTYTAITGNLPTTTDVDYFALTLQPGQKVSIAMTGPTGPDWDLYLKNSAGATLTSSTGTTTTENLSYTNSGTTAITVYPEVIVYATASTSPYTLALTYTGGGSTGNTVTASITTPSSNVTIASGAAQSFMGTATDSSSTATLTYAWTFGDGGTASTASASHTYTNTGASAVTYTATFKATDNTGVSSTATRTITVNPATTGGSSFSENFDSGTKAAYTTGNVTLASGSWTLNDALLGNTSSDPHNGTQSVRTRNSGKLTMLFDFPTGAQTVTVKAGMFGTDSSATWSLWYSSNGGSTWTQAGSSVTTSSTTLSASTFTVNVTSPIRFEIRKTDGSSNRVNFDDFQIAGY